MTDLFFSSHLECAKTKKLDLGILWKIFLPVDPFYEDVPEGEPLPLSLTGSVFSVRS